MKVIFLLKSTIVVQLLWLGTKVSMCFLYAVV